MDSKIEFWNWFKLISKNLLLEPTRADLIRELDDHVSNLGPFDWEIGPWEGDTYYFAISPGLDASKLEFTQEFVRNAPKCPGWNFMPSKPPKSDWHGKWKMKKEMGKEIWIDSSNWEYILYQFDDETFDMDIVINDIDGGDDTAIDIALTGYLGEETFMRLIKNIKIVSSFEESHSNKATLLKHIKKHIESILN